MLFAYRYVPHRIETFQRWIDHLVKVVWCRVGGLYSLNLLHPDLRAVVEDIANDDRITTDYLDGPIKAIDVIFQTQLNHVQRLQVNNWYDHNNDIEALCGNDPLKMPGTYLDIRSISTDLETALKSFFKKLFTDVIHLKAVTSRTADINSHYDDFVAENNEGKCPYCGIGDIDPNRREAYDHFLPKSVYPFNSVNFKNLAPMCTKCNSSYKLQRDPLRHIDPLREASAGHRRKAFYSYAASHPRITINIILSTGDLTKLSEENITLTINSPGRDEEVETWNDVFDIKIRYKTKCCAKNDGMVWLSRVIEENENYKLTPQEMIEAEIRAAEKKPWSDANFLKKPFLHACQNTGLI